MDLIDKAFGLSPQALTIRSQRAELIAANLANMDTPGYLARDIDFASALQQQLNGLSSLKVTDEKHLGGADMMADAAYRVPNQPSLDGNTVEAETEYAQYMDNAVNYQASLSLLDGRIKSLLLAIRGS